MRGHINRRLRRNRVLTSPQTRHRLLLCVKLEAWLSVKGVRSAACDRLLVTGEGEHGELDVISLNSNLLGMKENLQERGWAH
jgi:hypothetical protein